MGFNEGFERINKGSIKHLLKPQSSLMEALFRQSKKKGDAKDNGDVDAIKLKKQVKKNLRLMAPHAE